MTVYWVVGYFGLGFILAICMAFLASGKGREESSDEFVISAFDPLTLLFWPIFLPKMIFGVLRERPVLQAEITRRESSMVLFEKTGMAATDLRPSGEIEIEGESFQAISESGIIAAGSPVKVIGGDCFLARVEQIESASG